MKVSFIILFSLLITMSACKKVELKKPTTLNMQYGINSDESEINGIKFQAAELTLQTFSIIGKRIEGDDIHFTRSLTAPLNINLDGITNVEELTFDIPQGDYTELKIEFNNITSSYTARYKPSNGPTVDVIFELVNSHLFSIICNENDQSDLIQLDKNIDKTISIELNPKNWFESVTSAQLDNADIIIGNNGNGLGNSTILINPSNNISLYSIILGNIASGNKANFK